MARVSGLEPCVSERFAALGPDERALMGLLLDRMEAGAKTYGRWNIADGRDYPGEALEEVIDALHYAAAALLRQSEDRDGRALRIYVCHPYSNHPEQNCARVRRICRVLALGGRVPVAAQLYLPNFLEEATERELVLSLCKELIREHGITVCFAEDAS
jgi:hypothetical protein